MNGGERSEWVGLARFQDALQRSAQSVVRLAFSVGGTAGAGSTGWCITDTLVVVPRHVIHPDLSSLQVFFPGGTTGSGAEIVAVTGDDKIDDAALLRCTPPGPTEALTLSLDPPRAGGRLWMLHHPFLNPHIQYSAGVTVEVSPATGELIHDLDSSPGSSGGPLFDFLGRVRGTHIGWFGEPRRKGGRTIGFWLQRLRNLSLWPEIADYHRLVGPRPPSERPVAAPQPSPSLLLRLAVRSRFSPEQLTAEERRGVEPHVIDVRAAAWTLQPEVRRRTLEGAGSLEAMREARGPERASQPGQVALDRILRGPPFDLWEEPLADLPQWLQMVRWFAGLVPGLPTAHEVQRVLTQRRARQRLKDIAGDGFRGRSFELAAMHAWYAREDAGPLVITGIGGIGKSALVARFADELPANTVILWLDFDRADLAPDDADSILRRILAECEAQLELSPPATPHAVARESWQAAADRLGVALASELRDRPPPLMVLDSFEIAQHVERYQELWPVLQRLLAELPRLRIIVTGRGTLPNRELVGRPSQSMRLTGLHASDADELLRARGIGAHAMRRRLVELADGIPLVLLLGAHYLHLGGDLAVLPASLPRQIIEGYLYDRILARVVDVSLQPLARGVLVLRRVTADALSHVLGDLLPPGAPADQVFARLRREMALVDGDDVLRVRQEVRNATLRMLESEDQAFVRRIDEAAAVYYASLPQDDIIAAELVYHCLRLGDLHGAAVAWRTACATHLRGAEDDLTGDAHVWLASRLGTIAIERTDLDGWEHDALRRIRDLLARGLTHGVGHVLSERPERTPDSPLVFYDAWLAATQAHDVPRALALLGEENLVWTTARRDRTVLRAWLHARDNHVLADGILQRTLDVPPLSADDRDHATHDLVSLAITAARIWLTFEPSAEQALVEQMDESGHLRIDGLRQVLSASDTLNVELRARLGWASRQTRLLGNLRSIDFADAIERSQVHRLLLAERLGMWTRTGLAEQPAYTRSLTRISRDAFVDQLAREQGPRVSSLPPHAVDLFLAAHHRWKLLTTTSIAARIDAFIRRQHDWRMLTASVGYTLICLHDSPGWSFVPQLNRRPAQQFLAEYLSHVTQIAPARALITAKLTERSPDRWQSFARESASDVLADLLTSSSSGPERAFHLLQGLDNDLERYKVHATVASALPDPLDLLVRYLAGIPDA
ncbi:trypsin-like peptidase domain-containing protein [Nannocystis punicea]|uniref:Trypsin-like peptidase domain-containing protein n=1 Tax=Nannocystis punicea TaxID=2995304 RepID=A0ABY7HKG2_9BACT|nr:trypsin-like peptidase domain-containing protein [Nannocystis poenicansa]WAS99527.1 trypsin-like peptidase domain-containing protein [Nannocystis poenicansa]